MKVKLVGIDIDTHDKKVIKLVEKRILSHENTKVVHRAKTKHGYHYKVHLKRKISVKQSFRLRYFFMDDKHRLLRDYMRWDKFHNVGLIDTLFDKKTRIKEVVTL